MEQKMKTKLIPTNHLMSKAAIEGILKDEGPEVIGIELCEFREASILDNQEIEKVKENKNEGLLGKITSKINQKAKEQFKEFYNNLEANSKIDIKYSKNYNLNKNSNYNNYADNENNLDEKKSSILFLAKKLNTHNPLYFFECETTSQNIIKTFPYIEGHLLYFSDDYKDLKIDEIRKNSIIIPISNLIDNSEIIKNIEFLKTALKNQKKDVFISKTLNYNNTFIRSVFDIIDDKNFISNEMLLSL